MSEYIEYVESVIQRCQTVMPEWNDLPRAEKAAQAIMAEMCDRRGLRQELDNVDEGVKSEMITVWTKIIEELVI